MGDQVQVEDPLADFQAAQRRRKWVAVVAVVAVAGLAILGWAWRRATGLSALDPETTREVSEALDSLGTLPRELHAPLAAQAMVELEGERLPAAMVAAFRASAAAPPGQRGLVMMRPFAEDADSLRAWTVACPAGAEVLAAHAASGDIDVLFADCSLGRWSLIDGTAARRMSAGRLVLAHAAWGWLVDHHAETELERRVLRVFVQG